MMIGWSPSQRPPSPAPTSATTEAMRVRVLGSAAGGGLPQWNCGCRNCADARAGRLAMRTQDSLAVSDGEGGGWLLLNASPDIRPQLAACPDLHPAVGRRSPLLAIALTSGDV